jgi:phosphate transport system permease protein
MTSTIDAPRLDLRVKDPDDEPRVVGGRDRDEVMSLGGAIASSFALVWITYYEILPWRGILGFVVLWYLVFLAMYAGVSSLSHPRPIVVDRLMTAVFGGAGVLVGFALVTVVVYTVWRGRMALPHWSFFSQDGSRVGPRTRLSVGGISNAIVGSLIQLGIALGISLPLGMATAIFLTETGGWFTRGVRTVVEAMTALPDLLAGLFVYVAVLLEFHMQPNGLAVGLALSVTMTPIVARASEVQLRLVPGGLREASLALGTSQWKTVSRVVVPTARPGLATALILAAARGIGESAPLLIVSGASGYFTVNPLKEPMNSLPLYIYTNARTGQPLLITRAFAAATLLLFIVLVLFALTRVLARQRVGRR